MVNLHHPQLIYVGKTKKVYRWDRFLLLFYFNDNLAGFPGTGPDPGGNVVVGKSPNKGIFNLFLTAKIFTYLSENNLLNHYFLQLSCREALFWKTKKIPVEFVWRNFSAGRFHRENPEYGWLRPMKQKLFTYLKDDKRGDPPVDLNQLALDQTTQFKIKSIMEKLNTCLIRLFKYYHLQLIDFKAEFGWYNKQLIIIDELSTDTIRLSKIGTKKILNWLEVKKLLE